MASVMTQLEENSPNKVGSSLTSLLFADERWVKEYMRNAGNRGGVGTTKERQGGWGNTTKGRHGGGGTPRRRDKGGGGNTTKERQGGRRREGTLYRPLRPPKRAV